ncbi:MAG: hypothetical protein ABRQ39_06880 [Candidatus Eremiobacterota bacterium]
MEETLKQILLELKELKTDVKDLKGKATSLEGKIDKLAEKEENHFNQLANEIQYLYDGMDKRISVIEAKV